MTLDAQAIPFPPVAMTKPAVPGGPPRLVVHRG